MTSEVAEQFEGRTLDQDITVNFCTLGHTVTKASPVWVSVISCM